MTGLYEIFSQAQFIIEDGDKTTSHIMVSGRLTIDWNKYLDKRGLLECLDFSSSDVECNVVSPDLIFIGGGGL